LSKETKVVVFILALLIALGVIVYFLTDLMMKVAVLEGEVEHLKNERKLDTGTPKLTPGRGKTNTV